METKTDKTDNLVLKQKYLFKCRFVSLCGRAGLVISLRCMEYRLHHIWTVHWTHYVSGYCHKSYDSLWCGVLL